MYALFIDLEEVFDGVNWMGMWNILKFYGMGGSLVFIKMQRYILV